jgi:hypothetical protein
MATRARSAQGVEFSVHTAESATKVITDISETNPAVVTTSAAHGLASGDVGKIAAVVGMTQINGVTALIEVLSSTTFSLVGVDATGFTPYTSGGTFQPFVFTRMCEITAFNPTDPGAQLNEVSTICSTAKEFLGGLPDDGTATINFNWVPSDVGIEKLWALRDSGAVDYFRMKIPPTPLDLEVWFVGGLAVVQSASKWPTASVNAALQGNGSLKFSGGTTILAV